MKRYYIHNGEMPVHITEWGSEGAPVIFCLHGLGSTSLSFIEVAEELKDEYRILSVDAPGHGRTPPFQSAREYEMPRMAKWLDEVVDLLALEKFYFLSHSWGSFAALFYLKEYGERVEGSIFIDGGYQSKRLGSQTVEAEMAYYEKDFEQCWETWEDFLDLVKSETESWSPLKDIAAEDLALQQDNRFYWHARGTTAANIIRAMHKDDIEDIFEDMPPGIILLRATLPEKMNEQRRFTADRFQKKTGAVVKVIPETTHLLHWDRPEVVVQEIRERWVASQ